jgi:DEAD/DEAH box helicase
LHAGPGPGSTYGSTHDTIDHWRDNLAESGTKEFHEQKGLPSGAVRKYGPSCEEVFLPAAKKMAKATDEELVDIQQLDNWAQLAFEGTKKLNRIQSAVFETAYNTCENMLVCAPTGAGKTNIAMLAFLQLVKQNISDGMLDMGAVKAVYIAPMKALAQEVVTKFGERLKPLRMTVKEFTGESIIILTMHLSGVGWGVCASDMRCLCSRICHDLFFCLSIFSHRCARRLYFQQIA